MVNASNKLLWLVRIAARSYIPNICVGHSAQETVTDFCAHHAGTTITTMDAVERLTMETVNSWWNMKTNFLWLIFAGLRNNVV